MGSSEFKHTPLFIIVKSLKETYTYLKGISLPNIEPTDVTLVIVADFPELVLHEKHIASKSAEPYVTKTKLVWVSIWVDQNQT